MQRSRLLRLTGEVIPVALPIALGLMIALTAVNVPYWDEWEWAELVFRFHSGTLSFADLWVQHNEHRLFFPQLILLTLDRFGGWSPVREQFISLFFVVAGQIGIFVMIRRTIRGSVGSIAGILVSIMLYGLWQAENFTWGFQMAWFLCNTACIVVVALLTRPQRNAFHVFASILIALIASFSSSQGLLIWVVGAVAIALTQRRIGWTLMVWLCAALATWSTYAHGLAPSSIGHFDIVRHPAPALRYVLIYLGSPIAGWGGANLSTLAGLIVVSGVLASATADAWRPNRGRHLLRRAPWYALAVFPIACAEATAAGRAGYGALQALSSRYTSISGLAWIAAICIGATYLSRQRLPIPYGQRRRVQVATFIVVAALLWRSNAGGWHLWESTEATLARARSGLERSDPSALAKLYPNNARIKMLIEELRRVRDGPFLNG